MKAFYVKFVFTANNWGIQGYIVDAEDEISAKSKAITKCRVDHGNRKIARTSVEIMD